MPFGRIQAGERAEPWQRPACQNEVLTHQAEAGKVIAGPAAPCGGPYVSQWRKRRYSCQKKFITSVGLH